MTAINERSRTTGRRRIVLVKQAEHWVFEWTPGDEDAVVEHVGRLARADDADFDWFDAAAVCRQIDEAPARGGDDPMTPKGGG